LVHAAGKPGEGAGGEFLEIEGSVIENGAGFGVGRKQNLESTIEKESIHLIRADAAADTVRTFENLKGNACFVKPPSGAKTGETCAYYQDVRTIGHSVGFLKASPEH